MDIGVPKFFEVIDVQTFIVRSDFGHNMFWVLKIKSVLELWFWELRPWLGKVKESGKMLILFLPGVLFVVSLAAKA